MRLEAVKAGAATWISNDQGGAQFKWLNAKEVKHD
jgi:hypothetical protein